MREEQYRDIVSYLDGKRKTGFNGGVRIGFEKGKPGSIAETDNPDTSIPCIGSGFSIGDKIRMACGEGFHGTLFFVFREGEPTHFSYNRTVSGYELDMLLKYKNGCPAAVKRRISVTAKDGRRQNQSA